MSITDDGDYGAKQVGFLEIIWGEGFLSPGGIEELDLMLTGLNISNKELMKIDYKHTHILKKLTNDNGKIIPQRVTNMSRSIHTKITKAIKQARFLSLI